MRLNWRSYLAIIGLVGGVLVPGAALGASTETVGHSRTTVPTAARAEQPTRATNTDRELRGVWIASVFNLDWPSSAGLPAETIQAEFRELLDQVQYVHGNAVFVQIRPTSDVLWPAYYEPWSHWLTGGQDIDPGWDPLAFMVGEAHARGIEFHAWFNPYRASTNTDVYSLAWSHPARQHPEWVVPYKGQLYLDPGEPAVREHVTAVIMDAVSRYDIDGVHFDDYFYPYPTAGQEFDDSRSYGTYGYGDRASWRRSNVDALIQTVSQQIEATKPWVQFGVSPFGIWRNQSTDPNGSLSSGLQSYDALHADTLTWIRNGWLDYVAPQLYWPIGHEPAPFEHLLSWWANAVQGTSTKLYIGHSVAKVGTSNPWQWLDPGEMPRQFELEAGNPAVSGIVVFRVAVLRENPLGIKTWLAEHPPSS